MGKTKSHGGEVVKNDKTFKPVVMSKRKITKRPFVFSIPDHVLQAKKSETTYLFPKTNLDAKNKGQRNENKIAKSNVPVSIARASKSNVPVSIARASKSNVPVSIARASKSAAAGSSANPFQSNQNVVKEQVQVLSNNNVFGIQGTKLSSFIGHSVLSNNDLVTPILGISKKKPAVRNLIKMFSSPSSKSPANSEHKQTVSPNLSNVSNEEMNNVIENEAELYENNLAISLKQGVQNKTVVIDSEMKDYESRKHLKEMQKKCVKVTASSGRIELLKSGQKALVPSSATFHVLDENEPVMSPKRSFQHRTPTVSPRKKGKDFQINHGKGVQNRSLTNKTFTKGVETPRKDRHQKRISSDLSRLSDEVMNYITRTYHVQDKDEHAKSPKQIAQHEMLSSPKAKDKHIDIGSHQKEMQNSLLMDKTFAKGAASPVKKSSQEKNPTLVSDEVINYIMTSDNEQDENDPAGSQKHGAVPKIKNKDYYIKHHLKKIQHKSLKKNLNMEAQTAEKDRHQKIISSYFSSASDASEAMNYVPENGAKAEEDICLIHGRESLAKNAEHKTTIKSSDYYSKSRLQGMQNQLAIEKEATASNRPTDVVYAKLDSTLDEAINFIPVNDMGEDENDLHKYDDKKSPVRSVHHKKVVKSTKSKNSNYEIGRHANEMQNISKENKEPTMQDEIPVPDEASKKKTVVNVGTPYEDDDEGIINLIPLDQSIHSANKRRSLVDIRKKLHQSCGVPNLAKSHVFENIIDLSDKDSAMPVVKAHGKGSNMSALITDPPVQIKQKDFFLSDEQYAKLNWRRKVLFKKKLVYEIEEAPIGDRSWSLMSKPLPRKRKRTNTDAANVSEDEEMYMYKKKSCKRSIASITDLEVAFTCIANAFREVKQEGRATELLDKYEKAVRKDFYSTMDSVVQLAEKKRTLRRLTREIDHEVKAVNEVVAKQVNIRKMLVCGMVRMKDCHG